MSEILWEPSAAAVEASNLTAYIDHLRAEGVDVTTYPGMMLPSRLVGVLELEDEEDGKRTRICKRCGSVLDK